MQEAGTPPEQLQVFSWFRERVLARCPDNSITHHDVLRQLSADRCIFCHMISWHRSFSYNIAAQALDVLTRHCLTAPYQNSAHVTSISWDRSFSYNIGYLILLGRVLRQSLDKRLQQKSSSHNFLLFAQKLVLFIGTEHNAAPKSPCKGTLTPLLGNHGCIHHTGLPLLYASFSTR